MTRVLLVEDDILLAHQFMGVLQRASFEVTHARHAGEAITIIEQQLPDVIVLDILLPATSGLALLHELQSYSDTAQVPVIVCTSMADTLELDELQTYGVRRLLDKVTMQPGDIVTAVKALV